MAADTSASMPRDLRRVRVRTTLLASLVVGAALAAGSLGLLAVMRNQLVESIDEVAEVRAEDVAALVRRGDLPQTLANTDEEEAGVQVVEDGTVIASTANLRGEPVANFDPEPDDVVVETRSGSTRVLGYEPLEVPGPVVVYVTTSLEPMEEILAVVRGLLVIGVPVLFLVMTLLCWFVVGRTLHPVRVASERQRQFVSDASHELQSPLATMRTELEVALTYPDRFDAPAALGEVLEENRRMEILVQDLLFLARGDEGAARPAFVPIDLEDVVLVEVRRFRDGSAVPIDTSAVSAAPVKGRHGDLARMVRNLLDNAKRYTASSVRVGLRDENGTVLLTISDDGPGVPRSERERIFERFGRPDTARSAVQGGSGLGLAITRDIVEQHGGSIEISDGEPTGAVFTVRLPSA